MKQVPDDPLELLQNLTPDERRQVADYVAFLRWRASAHPHQSSAVDWRYSFLEHLSQAETHSSRRPIGLEVKTGVAIVGGDPRPALWMHPPVDGEALVEYHVPIPAGLREVQLRFAIGIRDGVPAEERLVAFRVRADGRQIWSKAAWPREWESYGVPLPYRSGDVTRLAFATDSLGQHPFAWAAWAEPELVGLEG